MCVPPRSAPRASPASPAPSRRTTGLGPVTSMTVEGIPGSSPPSSAAATPARIAPGTSSSRHGSGPPGRFALVATTTPSRATIAAVGPERAGTRTPIVSGRPAHSQRKRPAGLGTTSVNGPGNRARAIAAGRPPSSGIQLEQHVDARGDDGGGLDRLPPLEPVEVGGRLLVEGAADEAVDRVGRKNGELSVSERPGDALDLAHVRRPSTTRS